MEYFTKEKREEITSIILGALEKAPETKQLDFNQLVFGFLDIIHSTFLNVMFTGLSPTEREELTNKLKYIHRNVVRALEENDSNLAIDVVVMTSLLMDAVEYAVQEAIKDAQNK